MTAMALWIAPAHSQDAEQVKPVFEHVIPNVDGKSMVAVVVTYPPGGKSPSHHHARSAFIYAYRNSEDDDLLRFAGPCRT